MISYPVYKVIHLLGIFMLMLASGGVILHVGNGGSKASNTFRKTAAITHGIGMALVLIAGFGMMERLEIHWPFPGWLLAKIGIWVVFGGLIGAIYRKPDIARLWWWSVAALGCAATFIAIFKPF